MTKKKMGRPSKLDLLARKQANSFAPDGQLSDAYVCLEETYGYTNEKGVVAKLDIINAAVTKALAEASKLAKNSDRATAERVPWSEAVTPLEMIQKIDKQLWVTQRIAESIEANLVETALVITSLKRRRDVAQKALDAEVQKIPAGIEGFARRLHLAGLIASPLAALSNADIKAVVDIVNGRSAPRPADDSESISRPPRRNDPDAVRRDAEEADEMVRRSEMSRPIIEEVSIDNTIVPPARDYGERWLDEKPAPPEFWDSQVETGLPYRWQYREAATAEETYIVMGFPWPERDSWESFREHVEIFREHTEDFDFRLGNIEEMAVQFIGHNLRMNPADVPENWMKAWILLVWARHNPEAMATLLGDNLLTYFDGVAIPVATLGGLAMRELKPIMPA